MTNGRSVVTWMVLALTMVLAGCASPYKYTPIRTAVPDPVVGQKQFVVAPTVYAPDFVVGEEPEAHYLARKDERDRAGWQAAKATFDASFRALLATESASHGIITTAPSAVYTLHPIVHQLEPGYYAVVASGFAGAKMTIELRGPDGSEVDEILIDKALGPGTTLQQRIERAGDFCGRAAARYLVERTAAK